MKKNKIKLSLNKQTISELNMSTTKGGGLSIVNACPSKPAYPTQNSKGCCPVPKVTDQKECN